MAAAKKGAVLLILLLLSVSTASGAVVLNSSERIDFNVSNQRTGLVNGTGLDLNNNKVYSFFQTGQCSDYVRKINPDGSYECGSDASGGSQNLSQVLAQGNQMNMSINLTASQAVEIGAHIRTAVADDIAIGRGAIAEGVGGGDSVTAIGTNAVASGTDLLVVGSGSYARNDDAIALGISANASENDAVALGKSARAKGVESVAFGPATAANSVRSIAIGSFAGWESTEGKNAIIIGSDPDGSSSGGGIATGDNSIGIGTDVTASAPGAVAIGDRAKASNPYEATFGNLNGQELDVNVTGNVTVRGNRLKVVGEDPLAWIDGGTPSGSEDYSSVLRLTGEDFGDYKGAYMQYDGSGNQFILGVHDPADRLRSSDTEAIRIDRSTADVTVPNGNLDLTGNKLLYSAGGVIIGDTSSSTSDPQAVVIGKSASATGTEDVALGYQASVSANDGTAVGSESEASGAHDSTAIGWYAKATNKSATALGASSNATGERTVAIGNDAEAHGEEAVALGYLADAQDAWATALGHDAVATSHAAALGHDAKARADDATAVGPHAVGSGADSVAVGMDSDAVDSNAVAIGLAANASNTSAVAIGDGATAWKDDAPVAVGEDTEAAGSGTIAIGRAAKALDNHAAAFGEGAEATGHGAFAIGEEVMASGDQAMAFGFHTVADDPYEAVFGAFNGDELDVNVTGDAIVHGSLDMNHNAISDIGSAGSYFASDGDLHLPNSNLYMGGTYIREADDIAFNGGSNSYSAITLPRESGASLSITRNLGGDNPIMTWHRNNVTEVHGNLNMTDGGVTIKSDNTADWNNEMFISDRASTSVESGMRLLTDGSERWFLYQDNDGTEDLNVWSNSVGADVQRWDYSTGNIEIPNGNLNMSTNSIHMKNGVQVGGGTISSGWKDTVLGPDATTDGSGNAVSIGDGATANQWASIAIGYSADATGYTSVHIGAEGSGSSGTSAVGIGNWAGADADESVAIGFEADTYSGDTGSVAIGRHAEAVNSYEATFGNLNGDELDLNVTGNMTVHGEGGIRMPTGIAIGDETTSSGTSDSMAVGEGASAVDYATAVGTFADASGTDSVAVGLGADATAGRATSLGNYAKASADSAVAIGYTAKAPNPNEATFGNLGSSQLSVNVTGDLTVHGACSGCADIAELYNASEPVASGEIVMADSDHETTVMPATSTDRGQVLGVVTTNPAILFEGDAVSAAANYTVDPMKPGVALVGRVPVNVSLENGPIRVGDPITVSSADGVGMKAEESGMVVGSALESYDADSKDGTITVFVNPHHRVINGSIEQLKQENRELEQRVDALTDVVCQDHPNASVCS